VSDEIMKRVKEEKMRRRTALKQKMKNLKRVIQVKGEKIKQNTIKLIKQTK